MDKDIFLNCKLQAALGITIQAHCPQTPGTSGYDLRFILPLFQTKSSALKVIK